MSVTRVSVTRAPRMTPPREDWEITAGYQEAPCIPAVSCARAVAAPQRPFSACRRTQSPRCCASSLRSHSATTNGQRTAAAMEEARAQCSPLPECYIAPQEVQECPETLEDWNGLVGKMRVLEQDHFRRKTGLRLVHLCTEYTAQCSRSPPNARECAPRSYRSS